MNEGNDKSKCEESQILMMGYIDNELGPEEEERFKEHVYQCPQCAKELTQYQKMAELTSSLQIKEPADYEWERIYNNIFYKIENRFGWILTILGFATIFAWFIYELCMDWKIASWLRVGIIMAMVGFIFLLISALRRRLRIKKYERYEAVKR